MPCTSKQRESRNFNAPQQPLQNDIVINYNSGTNQLNYVTDAVSSGNYSDDIDNESSNNYIYDKIGNLTKDVSQEIDSIQWNVYGKISKVVRTSTSSKSDLEFHYDAMGNRICKIVKPRAGSGILTQENWTYTYYLRDASGNVLATYDRTFRAVGGGFTEKYNLKENDLYGSSRTGIRNTSFEVASVALTTSGYNGDGTINVTAVAAASGTALLTTIFNHKLGEKSYELTNHLGNVLVTVSDARTANYSGLVVTGWNAVVNSANDYYANGMMMEGRNYQSSNYVMGFNGKRKDDEITGSGGTDYDFGTRIYDARIGRFLSVDPLTKKTSEISPYCFANNNPIFLIDFDGKLPEEPITSGQIKSKLDDGKETSGYIVTIYVDQPVHGSSVPIAGVTDVGHAFISITKFNKDGTMTTANFGWYPDDVSGQVAEGSPFNNPVPGTLKDNSGHSYDAGISIAADESTVNNILTYAATYDNQIYDLYSNNCVNFASGAAEIAGINVPLTTTNIPGPTIFNKSHPGYSPGQLGVDIQTGKANYQPNGAKVITPPSEQTAFNFTNTGMTMDEIANAKQKEANQKAQPTPTGN